MSHELTFRANGKVEMAYKGETPWHGLGAVLQAGGSIEDWIQAAGMDWRVQRSVVRYSTARNPQVSDFLTLDERHVLFRSDNKAPLGVVSDHYKVVQPKEVLEFFRDLVEELGFELETAGTLHGGRKYWALARVTSDEGVLDRSDKVGGYLLLATSADGTTPTTGRFTHVRVVCQNTLSAAFAKKAHFSLSHRSRFDAAAAKAELGINTGEVRENLSGQMEFFRNLAKTKLTENTMVELTLRLIAGNKFDELNDAGKIAIAKKPAAAIIGNMATTGNGLIGADMRGANGTAWGWLNSVTQYVDHMARANSPSNRLDSAWFGRGNELKRDAVELVQQFANGPQVYVSSESTGSSLLDSVLAQPVGA